MATPQELIARLSGENDFTTRMTANDSLFQQASKDSMHPAGGRLVEFDSQAMPYLQPNDPTWGGYDPEQQMRINMIRDRFGYGHRMDDQTVGMNRAHNGPWGPAAQEGHAREVEGQARREWAVQQNPNWMNEGAYNKPADMSADDYWQKVYNPTNSYIKKDPYSKKIRKLDEDYYRDVWGPAAQKHGENRGGGNRGDPAKYRAAREAMKKHESLIHQRLAR
jgi:hypothetical protein